MLAMKYTQAILQQWNQPEFRSRQCTKRITETNEKKVSKNIRPVFFKLTTLTTFVGKLRS